MHPKYMGFRQKVRLIDFEKICAKIMRITKIYGQVLAKKSGKNDLAGQGSQGK
jgi:hypothetical protein